MVRHASHEHPTPLMMTNTGGPWKKWLILEGTNHMSEQCSRSHTLGAGERNFHQEGGGGVVCVHFYLTHVWSLSTLVTHLLANTNYFEADVLLSLCGWSLALNPWVCCVFGNIFLKWAGWRCQYNVYWNCGHTETITAVLVVPSHVFSAQSWLESHEVFLLRIPFLQRNFSKGLGWAARVFESGTARICELKEINSEDKGVFLWDEICLCRNFGL